MASSSWYRIADFRPKLRSHARIYRQRYRGRLGFVLQDRTSGKYQLCSPSAYYMISLMDGTRTASEIHDMACAAFPDEVIDESEVMRLLAMLHSTDVLHGDLPPDVSEITDRGVRQGRRKTLMRFLNPLAIRIPLLDPDAFLAATLPAVRYLFTPWAALAYVLIVGYAILLTGEHWGPLTENIADRVLVAENLLIMFLVYPLVKAIHELGHGYAVKRWGGEVHEIGVMFLVFMPVPYVDASAATAFPGKWQRALVGAAGILVELFLAALALFVWLTVEDGWIKACAYNVMLIGGVSTVLFNGNPLLRFDGYYVLQDILEIPNLGTRSTRHIAALVKRHLLGLRDEPSPAVSTWESRWMFCYGIASFVYRLFIMAFIVLFVASRFFTVGVLLAIWSVILMLGLPLFKQVRFLARGPALRGRRAGAMATVCAALAIVLAVLLLVPLPYNTVAEGIVWVPGEGAVFARSEGVIERIDANSGETVDTGESLLHLEDPFLDKEVAVHRARVNELELRLAEQDIRDRVGARIVEEQLRQARADYEGALERQKGLDVTAPSLGVLALPRAADMPGAYVRRGDTLGYIADFTHPVVRVVLDQDAIERVRGNTRRVDMRLVTRLAQSVDAEVLREVPTLTNTLPSPALSTTGGGRFALDPTDPQQQRVLQAVYNLELAPLQPWPVSKLGMRVYVRFSHDWEPVGWRLYRSVRRVFLRQLSV